MYNDTVTGTCFLNSIDGFHVSNTLNTRMQAALNGGGGWTVAGFIDNDGCRHVYNLMKNTYPILYQSPVRRSTRSGRSCFFVVYDTRKM